ncbi:nitrogen fixation protein NifQ [Paraburkholderia caballeronis]|uniref:nitrogen fixation protein NifQ n=1 Tax=Paraburkholderia caballeronis TaxID=416943 RepID=UPI001064A5FD|nr:nitrogen fixation protein NifQ [Paraburkholderia caballeronis]TDV24695.1 nitrogen fixation protein NifQ [Paraburkholderia caballeronis]
MAEARGGPTSNVTAAVAARCDELAGGAQRARSSDARLFARLVAAREVRGELALLGLSPRQLAGVFGRHFAAGAQPLPTADEVTVIVDERYAAFVVAMQSLLMGFASPDVDRDDMASIATIVAHACLRPDHLWRDLGLGGRDDVTAMLDRFFPALVARNVDGMRWKKFLARELALATGATPGPSPGCPGCEDFGFCFPAAH